jgi:hypothetical protein
MDYCQTPSELFQSLKRGFRFCADCERILNKDAQGTALLQVAKRLTLTEPVYDCFVCHASEDKAAFVHPLVEELEKRGIDVWYDDVTLEVGDSLRRSIDRGLATSRYGIVILSPAFFSKEWPQRELDGLVTREIEGRKVILPIWHNVTKEDVCSYSPPLADKVALNSSRASLEEIADRLERALTGS